MVTVAKDPAEMMRDVPAATADGVTVADLLATTGLAGTTVLAGRFGLDHIVRSISAWDGRATRVAKPHELLLHEGRALSATTVTELAESGAAALALVHRPAQQLLDSADELGLPVLLLTGAPERHLTQLYEGLLTQQDEVLAQADALHRAISAIVLGGGALPQIADEVSRLLDCVVLITTPDGRVLADEGSEAHRSALTERGLFDATGRFLVERLNAGVQPLAGAGSAGMTSIVAGGLDHGRIVAYRSADRLPPGTVQALESVAVVAALTITKELAVAAVEGKFRGDYLRDVLSGLVTVDEQVVAHCRSLGWRIDRPLVVVVAELDPADATTPGQPDRRVGGQPVAHRSQHERFASAWQQVMRARDRTAPVVSFSQEVVALLPVPVHAGRPGTSEAAVAEVVAAVSGDRGGGRRSFCAGVSRVVTAPAELATAYAQARKAVAVGRRVHGRGSVSHFDTLGVHRLLSLVPDPGELKTFAAEVLAELAGDTSDAVDLRMTLQTLLDTNLNVAETARLLHFHYNTLRYRIAKLERIIGEFTTDPNLRLDVALALQIVQMRGI